MRIFVCSLIVAAILGCNVKEDAPPANAENDDNQQQGRTPGGGASSLFLPLDEDRPVGDRGQRSQQQQPRQSAPIVKTIAKEPAKIVKWPEYKQDHPETVVVDDKVEGWDPFSTAGSAYVAMTNKIGLLQFQSDLNLLKASEGRPPTYEEFTARVKQYGIKYHDEHPYRLYGYNEETGTMVMLEDKGLKRKIYEGKGIPYPE